VAATRVVAVRAEEVFKQADGVLDLEDLEPVHDMRVATRRLRAALEVFASCFPPKRHRKAMKRVKRLADALGARRDVDVEIGLLEGIVAELDGDDHQAVERPLERMHSERQEANAQLAAFVSGKRLPKLRRRLEKLAGSARGMKARHVEGLAPGDSLRTSAARAVRTRLDELHGFYEAALAPEASAVQHDMRIAAKRLRYVLETVGACLGAEAEPARRACKDLQSVLGHLHDCDLVLRRTEGIESATKLLRERRERLFHEFVARWQAEASKGTWAALESTL